MDRMASEIQAQLLAWVQANHSLPGLAELVQLVKVTAATENNDVDESYSNTFSRKDNYQCGHQVQFGRTTLLFEGQRISESRENLSDMRGLVLSSSCNCRLTDLTRRRFN